MRSIRVDQFEFPEPGSEEALEIDFSRMSEFPHPDVRSFVRSTVGIDAAAALPAAKPFHSVTGKEEASEYMKRFADIEVPQHCDWPTHVLSDESWDAVHLVICGPKFFIRYRWSTSA